MDSGEVSTATPSKTSGRPSCSDASYLEALPDWKALPESLGVRVGGLTTGVLNRGDGL